MKVVVIGGVAAGMSAASKIKREMPSAEVKVFEKGGTLSYGACGLPYYVGDFNDDYRKLIARTPKQFQEAGIDAKLYHQVTGLDAHRKVVVVQDVKTGSVFEESYDKLMISTGASPIIPAVKGCNLLGAHTMKTLEDGIFLREFAKSPSVQDVVIIGGGYIGIESAEAFLSLGKRVRIIEAAPRILSAFDEEFAKLAADELVAKGVQIHTGEKLEEIIGSYTAEQVGTNKGSYPAQLVILSVGVRPATGFLQDTGIRMAANGGILVDRRMETSIPDIYAAGDCCLSYNRVLDADSYLPLGTVANKCGRIAGANMASGDIRFEGALASAAIKVCGIELFRTGIGEVQAKEMGIEFSKQMVTTFDHPAYYPGQTPIQLKIIYHSKTGKLLGAQLAGQKGAVLRGDVFATAIHSGLTIAQLGMLDLAYAPPFAGVWDAIHIVCNAAK